ncbi:MAG: divalent metal cation transporter [Gammaproteobacteria bacterium]|nr:divalent metal cation transporter [Gammaproteobacteria bacterium]
MGIVNAVCSRGYKRLCLFLMAAGPGIIVMLADTDVGSLITAAQSGAVWGYKLLSLQIILIPILYITQELTLRLGITTGAGHGELIKKHFGRFWAWFSVITLVICCVGALISELTGIAGIGLMFGVSAPISMILTVAFLVWLVLTKSYNSVERVALAIGIFELVYLFVAWKAHPSLSDIFAGLKSAPLHNANFLYLASANIGAVIMPWMIFYQQSAVIDKNLTREHLNLARFDTFVGAIVTQVIMCAVIIATAATIGKTNPGAPLHTIQEISNAITPFLGPNFGKILFALGMLGAALVATIVVLLTAAWSIGEITGYKHSLQDEPKEAPWFYGIFITILIAGGVFVSIETHHVNLNIAIEVMNSLLLPIVLGFLYILALKTLPEEFRLKGFYAVLVGAVLFATSIFGLVSGIIGIFS